MDDRNTSTYTMFKGVQTFGTTNLSDFAIGSRARVLFTRMDTVILGLDQAKISQLREQAAKETLTTEIRLDLVNIARTAREHEVNQPGFAAPYQMPANTSEQALTTHCDRVLDRLEPKTTDTPAEAAAKLAIVEQFISYELPDDFVTDLRAERDELERINKTKREDNQEGVGGTATIDALIAEGKKIVKALNAIMHNKYTRVADKLRAWKSASHIERPQKKKDDEEPPAPTPTPPPAQ